MGDNLWLGWLENFGFQYTVPDKYSSGFQGEFLRRSQCVTFTKEQHSKLKRALSGGSAKAFRSVEGLPASPKGYGREVRADAKDASAQVYQRESKDA